MAKPQNPSSAQLTQLGVLSAAVATATATYNSAVTTMNTAQAALVNAQRKLKAYETYCYSGQRDPGTGIIDDGQPAAA